MEDNNHHRHQHQQQYLCNIWIYLFISTSIGGLNPNRWGVLFLQYIRTRKTTKNVLWNRPLFLFLLQIINNEWRSYIFYTLWMMILIQYENGREGPSNFYTPFIVDRQCFCFHTSSSLSLSLPVFRFILKWTISLINTGSHSKLNKIFVSSFTHFGFTMQFMI